MNAATINVNAMGIEDFAKAISANKMSTQQVLSVLDQRIENRKKAGKSLIARVVAYRNELAEAISAATGSQVPMVPAPSYVKTVNVGTLPTDPKQIADLVFAAVGPKVSVDVISALTSRIAGK